MKKFLITVNGNQYEVDVEEITQTSGANITRTHEKETIQQAPQSSVTTIEKPAPVKQAPAAAKTGTELISSPMPGTILKVPVKIGQEIKRSQVLCVLEAMKMENEIVSPRDGIIADIMTTKGSTVNAGDPLVSLE